MARAAAETNAVRVRIATSLIQDKAGRPARHADGLPWKRPATRRGSPEGEMVVAQRRLAFSETAVRAGAAGAPPAAPGRRAAAPRASAPAPRRSAATRAP